LSLRYYSFPLCLCHMTGKESSLSCPPYLCHIVGEKSSHILLPCLCNFTTRNFSPFFVFATL
jgi:hypothetical protein